jgi:uncharacterized membrane protein YphA (DoxX/SURF4 family)
MDFLKKISPWLVLRLGLGAMFLYSGYSLVTTPRAWLWAVELAPQFLQDIIESVGTDLFLRGQGVIELAVALVFLGWFLPRRVVLVASVVASLEMFSILLFVGVNSETFRDIGLLGGTVALFVSLWRQR